MITVILENADSNQLSKSALPGNERFLIRNETAFPLLSTISDCSYDVFSHQEMCGLISELEILTKQLGEAEKAHVNEIIRMASCCMNNENFTITFTPFE